jgi:anaerobic selenocysteine-containing dehydrogenase
MATEEIHTYCPMCIAQCGVVAIVEDGHFTKVTPRLRALQRGNLHQGIRRPRNRLFAGPAPPPKSSIRRTGSAAQ